MDVFHVLDVSFLMILFIDYSYHAPKLELQFGI